MNPLELIAQAKARKLAEEAAGLATMGGDPAALDSTLGPPALSEPRVPRQPSESQLADRQFAQTGMHHFMQQRDEPGGMSSPTEFAGQMSGGGKLASGAGSGMPKNVLQMMINKRKQLDAPHTPDPNVVAQARAKYADEARGLANAASGTYGGNAGDMMMGGGGPNLPGALSLIPRRGMRPMNAREMIAYDGQKSQSVLDLARAESLRRNPTTLGFEERAALERLKNEGRMGVQEAITGRQGPALQTRRELHAAPTGTALLGAETADKDREERSRQFDEELTKKYGRLEDIRAEEADNELADLDQAIAVKEAEHKARSPGWFGPNQKDAKGKVQPGLYEKQAAEIEWMKRRREQLSARKKPAAAP